MPPKLIPAISGAETTHFDTMFWKGVTEKKLVKKKTVPKTGSIGVFWHLYKDLSVLGTEAIARQKINKIYPRAPEDGKTITAANAKALKAFYEWCQQSTEPLFFIKKGTQPLWLCRKTGTYYYEDRTDDPFWYPHRIGFEFVRAATEAESIKRLGIGMNTMIWIELAEEIPKQETPVPAEMPPKKTTTKTVTAAKTTERKIENPVKKRAGRKPKTNTVIPETVVEPLVLQESIQATYVETEEEPLEVEMIKVQAFELDGTDYYREPIKNKLYKRLTGGGIGPYVGRYSPKDEKVHEEIEDSDQEEGF
jgi:hypothetical protein